MYQVLHNRDNYSAQLVLTTVTRFYLVKLLDVNIV